ncbi:MAG: DUF177 domain-containing protein [Nevskia sp.]|nr:DUF177 domain-containing protein [Nevskia sp.]
MKNAIPLRVKAAGAVAHGSAWRGELPVADLGRLAAAVAGREGSLRVELHAGRDASGAARLHGSIDGELELSCQHCLGRFRWPLRAAVDLRLVGSEAEERRLLRECEPWLVQDDSLPLREIVEDEALLALPIAPRCPACA